MRRCTRMPPTATIDSGVARTAFHWEFDRGRPAAGGCAGDDGAGAAGVPNQPDPSRIPRRAPGYQLKVKTTDYPPGTYTLSFTTGTVPTTHTLPFVVR